MAAKFIAKRREFIEHRVRAYGGRVACYGPWKTLGSYEQSHQAIARIMDETRGLFQTGVFYKGKRLV